FRSFIVGIIIILVGMGASLLPKTKRNEDDAFYLMINNIKMADKLRFTLYAIPTSLGLVPIETPETRAEPNEGLWRSLKNSLKVAFPFLLANSLCILLLVFGKILNIAMSVYYNQVLLLLFSLLLTIPLVVGGLDVFKHFVLR